MKIKKIIRSITAPKETLGVLWVNPNGFSYFEEGVWKEVSAQKFKEINDKLEELTDAVSSMPTTPPTSKPTPAAGQGAPDFTPSEFGMFYIDTTAESGGLYYSIGNTSVGDWRQA
jgi:hypothetical protein